MCLYVIIPSPLLILLIVTSSINKTQSCQKYKQRSCAVSGPTNLTFFGTTLFSFQFYPLFHSNSIPCFILILSLVSFQFYPSLGRPFFHSNSIPCFIPILSLVSFQFYPSLGRPLFHSNSIPLLKIPVAPTMGNEQTKWFNRRNIRSK